jgi:isoquinoline 1-oxidoreductase subunit beta
MTHAINESRRDFFKSSAALGGGLVLGFYLPESTDMAHAADAAKDAFAPNAFIRITKDNVVTLITGNSEMGQGVMTSLPQIIADELDADWSKIRYEQGGASPAFFRPGVQAQITGGSWSVRANFKQLRQAGAAARQMLVSAASEVWGVDASQLKTENGYVIGPGGKRASYGELVDAARTMEVPKEPKLKDPKDWKIIGQNVKRLDTPAKVNGSAKFGMDVDLPGMLTAVVARAPVFNAQVKSFNADKAKAIKGVKQVVQISSGVAVVAEGFWPAKQGRDALEIEWSSVAGTSTSEMQSSLKSAAQRSGLVARKEGDVTTVQPAKTIEAKYDQPYLAHACMEPMNCTAWVKPDGVELWVGTQAQTNNQTNAATIAGVKPEQVKVNTMFLGGGFGRRAVQDFVASATEISKAVNAPVKLVYTREDDMRSGYYRPISYTELTGGLDDKGNAVLIKGKIVVPSLAEFSGFKRLLREDGIDRVAVEGLADMAYGVPNILVDWVNYGPSVPIWFWRSVGATHNTFAMESFIDEMAHAAGKDPFEFRRALLDKHPRHKGVLELAAQKAGWGTPPPKGVGRGIALVECFGGWTAQVAEVSVDNGKPKVHRVVCAADCGVAVNPEQVKAQMESAIIYALSAVLYGQITFQDGKVDQGNFDSYPVVRMNETPKIEVHIVPSTEPPGGVGEPGTPPLAPAVANAIFAASGKRIRSLPIGNQLG